MQLLLTIFCLSLTTLASTTLLGQKKPLNTTLYTTGYYSGTTIVLKPDMTFTQSFYGHIFSDTAAGTYKLHGDTITLNYDYNNYEAMLASYKKQHTQVPIDIQLAASRVGVRSKTIIKKRSKYYVLDVMTGKLNKMRRG